MSNKVILLKTILIDTSSLHSLVKSGSSAVDSKDLGLIDEPERRRIGDSLNLDEASRHEYPNANRWDYIVSVKDLRKLVGIEPHTLNDSQIRVVIKKKEHAQEYLRKHLKKGFHVSTWYWVSHGRTGFTNTEKARRTLDQNGITFKTRMITKFE